MTITLLPMACVGCGVDVPRPAIRCRPCRKELDRTRPRRPTTRTYLDAEVAYLRRLIARVAGGAK